VAFVTSLLLYGCGSGPSSNNTNTTKPINTATVATSPSPSLVCDDNTVKGQIANLLADKAYDSERRHINYFSKSCQVTLQGWVSTQDLWNKLVNDVKALRGVTGVNTTNFYTNAASYPWKPTPGVGCPPGYKQCGDMCIPEGDDCNITLGTNLATPTPAPPSPSNDKSKSN
jgi:hypothetical protein